MVNKKNSALETLWSVLGVIIICFVILCSIYWLYTGIRDVIFHFLLDKPEKVIFARGQFSSVGILMALTPMIVAGILNKKNSGLSVSIEKRLKKIMVYGLILFFLIPTAAQLSYNARYANDPTYYYCQEESNLWLFSLTRVYVKDMSLCSAENK